jgi:hypothetical protein
MAYVNLPPSLQLMFQTMNDRLGKMENGQRFTAPNVPPLTTQPTVTGLAASDPQNPRTGDVWLNTASNALRYVDAVGAVQSVTGSGYRLLTRLFWTSTTQFLVASYSGAKAIRVICVGSGGGGGGVANTGGSGVAIGGSGSGGGYSEKFITTLSTVDTWWGVVGASGAGGAAGANAGTAGSSSWFGPSNSVTTGATVIANGGGAGAGGTSSTGANYFVPGVAGASASTGDFVLPGGSSTAIYSPNANNTVGTSGGASVYGFGGLAVQGASTAGNAGGGYGSGGSGAGNGNSGATKAGGSGASGLVIVEVYA